MLLKYINETDRPKICECGVYCVKRPKLYSFMQLQGLALSESLISLVNRMSFAEALTATAFCNSTCP